MQRFLILVAHITDLCYNNSIEGDIMANTKRRRRKKKNNNNIVLIVMLVIIIGVIAIFAVEAGKNKEPSDETSGDSTQQITNQTADGYYDDNNVDSGNNNEDDDGNDSHSQSGNASEPSQTEESSSTTEEATTEPETLPLVQEPENVSDKVVKFYTSYMGYPEGSLFIKDSETKETATGYTFILRSNAGGSPNKYVFDVYVEKGTGNVTDSQGNVNWNLSDE